MTRLINIGISLICTIYSSIGLASSLETRIYDLLQTKYESHISDAEEDYSYGLYFLKQTLVIEDSRAHDISFHVTIEVADDGFVEQHSTDCLFIEDKAQVYCDYFYY